MQELLNQSEYRKLTEHFGHGFHTKVMETVKSCSDIWRLSDLRLVDYYSVNCLFTCRSEIHGNAVLKICNVTKREVRSELNALNEFGPGKCCRLLGHDVNGEVMLLERLMPGDQLKAENDLEKRLSVFSGLFNGLHQIPADESIYGTYTGWIFRIADFMRTISGHNELTEHMQKARDIYDELASQYSRKMLLHGDFHYDNILKDSDGYRIIDPKGVLGDPVFDLPRYTLNEYCDSYDSSFDSRISLMTKVMGYFEKSLGIPVEVQKKSLYVEMAMSNCWNVESGTEPDIGDVRFAELLMNRHR